MTRFSANRRPGLASARPRDPRFLWRPGWDRHRLLGGREFDPKEKLLDHLLPRVSARGHAAAPAHGRRQAWALLDQAEGGHQLDRVVGLEDQRVAIRIGVVLARRAGDGKPTGRHYFEADQAERLVPGVGEHGVAGGVDHAEHGIAYVAREIDHISVGVLTKDGREPGRLRRCVDVDDVEALVLRVADDLTAVRFATPAQHQSHPPSVPFDVAGRRHRHQPALVGIEAADLETEMIGGGSKLEVGHRLGVAVVDRFARDPVGDDDRVVATLPDLELHVAADRGDGGGERERGPIHAVEAEGVVGVPQDHDAIAKAAVVQRIRNEVHRPRRVPLLTHDHDVVAGLDRRPDHGVDEALRETRVPVADLLLLAVVDTAAMAPRDPLAPAPIDEPARLMALLPRQVGIATEIEVGLVAELGQRSGQALHADAEATGLAVHVGTLEAEDHEDGALGLEDHGVEDSASRAVACSSRLGAQTSEVRVSRVQGSELSALPLMSVATPPLSATMRRLAAMSNTRTGTGAQKASKLPAAVCAIASAIEPRIRILVDRWMRPRAPTSALGRLSSAISSRRSRDCRFISRKGSPPRFAPCLRIAVQASPLIRLTTQPTTASPMVGPSTSASITPKNGTPCLALRLPSTGSTNTSG